MSLSEQLALFETLEAMAANYTPWIEALEDEVEALSNKFPISYERLLDKPVL